MTQRGLLIGCIEQENKRNDSVGRTPILSFRKRSRAYSLEGEEDDHAADGDHKEDSSSNFVDHWGCQKSPEQVPYLKDTINEQLDGWIRNADSVENLVKIVWYKTVARPLRKEGKGDDNAHALSVSDRGEEWLPSNSNCGEYT